MNTGEYESETVGILKGGAVRQNFKLTQRHINGGRRFKAERCPLAICIRENFVLPDEGNLLLRASASNDVVVVGTCESNRTLQMGRIYRAAIPPSLRRWVNHFDRLKNVSPIKFYLSFEQVR